MTLMDTLREFRVLILAAVARVVRTDTVPLTRVQNTTIDSVEGHTYSEHTS
jgi:hypothetical protein